MHCAKFIQILQNMSRAKINFENRCYKELSALGHWTPTHLVVVRKVMWEQLLRRRGQQPCANLAQGERKSWLDADPDEPPGPGTDGELAGTWADGR